MVIPLASVTKKAVREFTQSTRGRGRNPRRIGTWFCLRNTFASAGAFSYVVAIVTRLSITTAVIASAYYYEQSAS